MRVMGFLFMLLALVCALGGALLIFLASEFFFQGLTLEILTLAGFLLAAAVGFIFLAKRAFLNSGHRL